MEFLQVKRNKQIQVTASASASANSNPQSTSSSSRTVGSSCAQLLHHGSFQLVLRLFVAFFILTFISMRLMSARLGAETTPVGQTASSRTLLLMRVPRTGAEFVEKLLERHLGVKAHRRDNMPKGDGEDDKRQVKTVLSICTQIPFFCTLPLYLYTTRLASFKSWSRPHRRHSGQARPSSSRRPLHPRPPQPSSPSSATPSPSSRGTSTPGGYSRARSFTSKIWASASWPATRSAPSKRARSCQLRL